MFLGIVVELDGGSTVIMRINIDADVVADNMVCLFDTLVEVLDVQRFALVSTLTVREPPVISRILPSMTANFRTRSGVVSNLICVCG